MSQGQYDPRAPRPQHGGSGEHPGQPGRQGAPHWHGQQAPPYVQPAQGHPAGHVHPGHPHGLAHPGAMMHPHPIQPHSLSPGQGAWTRHFAVRQTRSDPKQTWNIVLIVLGSLATFALGLGLLGILLIQSLAFEGVGIVIVLLSGIPLVAIVGTVLLLDRWKPQPLLLMALCVLWGAVASVVLTFVFQLPTILVAGAVGVDLSGDVVGAVVMAPVFEETAKTVFLVVIVLAARRFFEGPLDGMMYGTLIGAGFAFTENLLYLSSAYAEASAAGLITLFFVRCIMSPLLHSSFTALAGLSIGLAARRGQWWMTLLMWIPGLIGAMILHALWNGTATLTSGGPASLIVMLAMSVLIAAGWWTTMIVLWFRETRIARESLLRYAGAGWLTQEEAQMLGTWGGRRAGRRWASHGPARRHMKEMTRMAASLPTVRQRVEAGVGGDAEREYEVYLLKQLTMHRQGMMAAMGLPAR